MIGFEKWLARLNLALDMYDQTKVVAKRTGQVVGDINEFTQQWLSKAYYKKNGTLHKLLPDVDGMTKDTGSKRAMNTSAGASGSATTYERDVRQVKPRTKGDSHLDRTYPHIIDGHQMGIGAEKLLNTLVCRLNNTAYCDNVKEFLSRMNRKLKFTSQFALQLLSNEQQRHTQIHWFRHSHGNASGANSWPAADSVLSPVSGDPVSGKTDPTSSTFFNVTGLNVNGFGDNQNLVQGYTMVAPVSRQDLEEMSLKCYTQSPSFNEIGNEVREHYHTVSYLRGSGTDHTHYLYGNDIDVTRTSVAAFPQDDLPFESQATGTHPTQSKLQIKNNVSNAVSSTVWQNRLKAVIVDGGVNYLFENKHGTDAKIEIIIVKVKKGHEEEASVGVGNWDNVSNMTNSGLSQYASELGKAWVKRQSAYSGTDNLGGKAPLESDIWTNPYYPLLPEDTRNCDVNKVHFTQKKRFAFCLPSGAKRQVKIPFGGHVYDPSHCRTGPTANLQTTNLLEPGIAVGVIIAINGQLISSNSVKDTMQLISRDMISASNVVIMGEYYERVQACKLDSEPTSKLYSRGDIDPVLAPTEGWTTEALQIIPSSNIIRGATQLVNIGHTTRQQNGGLHAEPDAA